MDEGPKGEKVKAIDWCQVGEHWAGLESCLGKLSFAQTAANADKMQNLLDGLLVATEQDNCPAALHSLLDCISDWLQAYEATTLVVEESDPIELLKHLMDANGLKQRDVADLLGGQSVVSAVLRRKRSINAKQASRLGQYFGISAAAFIAKDEMAEPQVEFNVRDLREGGSAPTHMQGSVHWLASDGAAVTLSGLN